MANKTVYTVQFDDADLVGVKSNMKAAYEMALAHNREIAIATRTKKMGRPRKGEFDKPLSMRYNQVIKELRAGKTVELELVNHQKAYIAPALLEAK